LLTGVDGAVAAALVGAVGAARRVGRVAVVDAEIALLTVSGVDDAVATALDGAIGAAGGVGIVAVLRAEIALLAGGVVDDGVAAAPRRAVGAAGGVRQVAVERTEIALLAARGDAVAARRRGAVVVAAVAVDLVAVVALLGWLDDAVAADRAFTFAAFAFACRAFAFARGAFAFACRALAFASRFTFARSRRGNAQATVADVVRGAVGVDGAGERDVGGRGAAGERDADGDAKGRGGREDPGESHREHHGTFGTGSPTSQVVRRPGKRRRLWPTVKRYPSTSMSLTSACSSSTE
jgi:hypothetical protein